MTLDFTARDCVTVVPPHNIVAANVDVLSNIGGTLIETSPPDRNNDSGGFTNLALAYTPNTQVDFTAPASRNGVAFRQWFVGGVPQPFGQRTVPVQVNNHTVVPAGYGTPIRLQGAPHQASGTY